VQIPHVYRTAARGSPKRQKLFEQRGTFQVPYLEVGVMQLCSVVVCHMSALHGASSFGNISGHSPVLTQPEKNASR
jgi:hypothetical protein